MVTIYGITTLVLCVNLLLLWAYSGWVRARSRVTPNLEDARTVASGASVSEHVPEPVARVLRAHANATAAIIPFLLAGWLYVVLGGAPAVGWVLFVGFTAARLAHTGAYLAAVQPARTATFVLGMIATLAVMGNDVWLLL
jgi:microsomal prostaglandin-E synthase 1